MKRIIILLCSITLVFYSVTDTYASAGIFSVNDKFSDTEIKSQIKNLSSEIDVIYSQEIKSIINTYISSGRRNTEVILSRSQYYFPIIEKIMLENNMPDELKYLSVIESGLRPAVRSRVGAVGLWQFMTGTAKEHDLRINSIVDERKDVRKSTEAAVEYLSRLHKKYGDWTLALAAYNCGPGNINKAIRKAGGKKNFWEIRQYLPKETRRYIPKLIATMYVMNHFEAYGLDDETKKFSDYSAFGVAQIFSKTSFKDISQFSGLTVDELKKYNPSYTQHYIPASTKGYNLIMPEGYLLTFLQNKQWMKHFQEAFYLKNTIVKFDALTVEAAPAARDAIADEMLETISMGLSMPTYTLQTKTQAIRKTEIVDLSIHQYRLRKRQSLQAWIEENNIDLSMYTVSVNAQGIVTVSDK